MSDYTKTIWENNKTPLNATNLNKIEEGIYNNAINTRQNILDIDKVRKTANANAQKLTEVEEHIEEKTIYTNTRPTTSTLGGIPKGTTFTDKPVLEILESLLYPYVSFYASLTTTPSAGVFELGTSVVLTNATVSITLGSASIAEIKILDSSDVLLGSKTSNITGGDNNISITKTLSSTDTIKAVVTDSTNQSKTISSSPFIFVNPYYYGAISDGIMLTEDLVKGLTKSVTTKGSKSFTIAMNQQRGVIAYPSSYGPLSKILDENSFNVTDSFIKNTLTINGVDYNVYVLNNPVTSTMKYSFSY